MYIQNNEYVWLILDYILHPDYDFPIPPPLFLSPKGTFPSFFLLLSF